MVDRLRGWILFVVDWFADHPAITGWIFGASVLLFLGSLVVMPLLLARMRSDYFVRGSGDDSWGGRHAILRLVGLVVKNFIGVALLVSGIAMIFLPGPGIVTILVAISFLNFPGKRRIELRIVRQRQVLKAINWIRERNHRPPLVLPEPIPVTSTVKKL